MISVINKPLANITGDENNISKWVGAHQPMEFEIQRKDYNVLAIWNQTINNTACKVFQIQGNRQSDFAVGTTFNYVCSDDTLYSFTLTVFNVDFDGSRTYVAFERAGVFNISKISANQAFVNVTRLGHYIETLVYIHDKAGVGTLVGTLRTKTDTFGKSKVNVQKVISSYLTLENKFEYDKINKAQPTQGGQYQIRCREVYGVFEGKFTAMLSNDVLFYVNGSKQLQDPNNFNFGEFVPTQNDAREDKAKFLSVFNKPTYFNGYPFSLSFIYSDNLGNKQIERAEQPVDVNNATGSTTKTDLLVGERGFVNRLMISGSYASSVKSVNVWLENGGLPTAQNPVLGIGDLAEPETIFDGFVDIITVQVIDLGDWGAIKDLRDRARRFTNRIF